MATVFLSTLGTNPYTEVIYEPLDGEEPTPATPYVQESRVRALLDKGILLDRVLVCVTEGDEGSRVRNWDRRCRWKEEPTPDGLKARLQGLGVHPEPIPIVTGATEGELWSIFRALDEAIDVGDALYVDITHGFRSQAIVLMTALDYLQRAKEVELVQVSYGAWEAKGKTSSEPRPTFDLTPFFALRDWTAALALLEAGDLRALGRTLGSTRRDLGKVLQRSTPRSMSKLPKALENLGEDLWCNRLRELPSHVRSVDTCMAELEDDFQALGERADREAELRSVVGAMAPLSTILGQLRETMDSLRPSSGDHPEVQGLLAASFCIEKGLLVQGLTLLRESLVDLVERLARVDRGDAEALLGALAARENEQAIDEARLSPTLKPTLDELPAGLGPLASRVTEDRNKLDHAGTGPNAIGSLAKLTRRARKAALDALELSRAS